MARLIPSTALAGIPAEGTDLLSRAASLPEMDAGAARAGTTEPAPCHHCGQPCPPPSQGRHESDGHLFCCLGCQTVFGLLHENGLDEYYRMGEQPGVRIAPSGASDRWAFLDDPAVSERLLEYRDERLARVTFHLPAIHCVACVWLLENLFRLNPAIGRSRVNFGRREVALAYTPERVRLSEIAALLTRLGYEPELTLAELDRPAANPVRRLARQIGIAGFAFGNVMLFSLPSYLGLDSYSGPAFRVAFGALSLLLALPAVVYSAADYWRSAFASLRQRTLTLDVPIAAGLAAIYGQSAWEILTHTGEGYLDSLCGLIFFLLCGRAFQQKTHERLGFDRDYRGFFPLAVLRRTESGTDETVAISRLAVGDRLTIRHGELVPADARLIEGEGVIDYSFVTGESEPVARRLGDHLFAGGRQVGGSISVETLKPVSQSYLTSLWNDEAFRKPREDSFSTLTNRYSRRFTVLVLAVAVASAAGWALAGIPARGLKAFVSVLIVACPCALALAAPFTLGTAQRLLSRRRVFLRNAQVIESLADIDTVVFDKTGTLTAGGTEAVSLHGATLDPEDAAAVAAICAASTHPYARRVAAALRTATTGAVAQFREEPGRGVTGTCAGRAVAAGSRAWLEALEISGLPAESAAPAAEGGTVFVALDGRFRGVFVLGNRLRPEVDTLVRRLAPRYALALLSGDNERERERFAALFGPASRLQFNTSPPEKLAFVRALQSERRRVMMVGDGLNDAGALRQGDVGVAVVEGVGRFSPASDVIADAAAVPDLAGVLDFARRSVRIVRTGFVVSGLYNLVGVGIAAAGVLSPIVCAILMPLSSVTVVLLAVGATRLAAARAGLGAPATALDDPAQPKA